MMARLSQMTVLSSHRIGTLPPDGANSSPSRRRFQSSSNMGTVISSNGRPDCFTANQPRRDQDEQALLPMMSLSKASAPVASAYRLDHGPPQPVPASPRFP